MAKYLFVAIVFTILARVYGQEWWWLGATGQHTIRRETIKEKGDTFKLQCNLENTGVDAKDGDNKLVNHHLEVNKNQQGSTSKTQLSSNGKKSGDVPRNGFEVDDHDDDDTAVVNWKHDSNHFNLTLTFPNLMAEDTGIYTCSYDDKDIKIIHTLWVYEPVDTPQFDQDSNSDFTYKEGDNASVTCTANGGVPRPNLTITLGNNDVTDDDNSEDKITLDGEVDKKNFQTVHYTTIRRAYLRNLNMAHDENALACTANVKAYDGYDGTVIEAKTSVVLIVHYLPKLLATEECQRDSKLMKTEGEQTSIKCIVTANPQVTEASIYEGEQKISSEFKNVAGFNNKRFEILLNIPTVAPDSTTYEFFVVNAVGNLTFSITVTGVKKITTTPTPTTTTKTTPAITYKATPKGPEAQGHAAALHPHVGLLLCLIFRAFWPHLEF